MRYSKKKTNLPVLKTTVTNTETSVPGEKGTNLTPIHTTAQSSHYDLPEAYHLEAYNFSLYVRNNAGVFQPANQNHRIFFCPNMESAD